MKIFSQSSDSLGSQLGRSYVDFALRKLDSFVKDKGITNYKLDIQYDRDKNEYVFDIYITPARPVECIKFDFVIDKDYLNEY